MKEAEEQGGEGLEDIIGGLGGVDLPHFPLLLVVVHHRETQLNKCSEPLPDRLDVVVDAALLTRQSQRTTSRASTSAHLQKTGRAKDLTWLRPNRRFSITSSGHSKKRMNSG